MTTEKTNRQCGECTACCEGWLTGEVNGHKFMPSVPCYYMTKGGCSIYEDRPTDPCRNFVCDWIINDNYPEWMKPTESGTLSFIRLFTKKDGTAMKYRTVAETRPMTTEVLFFYMRQFLNDGIPLRIQLNGNWNFFGFPDLVDTMT